MNAQERFAATFREKKGPEARTGGNEPPASADGELNASTHLIRNGRRPAPYSFEGLKEDLRKALRRAKKAEAALKRENQPGPRLIAAWKRNEELQAQLREALARAAKAEAEIRREDGIAAKLRESARVNVQLSGRYTGALNKLTAAQQRIAALESENNQLRKFTQGEST
jgi:hypothetical protein